MKVERNFTIFYAILTTTEITAEISGNTLLVYITKPLLVISLLCYFVLMTKNQTATASKSIFTTALIFALLGDIFLMIRNRDLFIPGLGAFLVMQWLYIVVFSKPVTPVIFNKKSLIWLLPFLVYAVSLFMLIAQKLEDPIIKSAVAIYAASISLMAWTTFTGFRFSPDKATKFIFTGALLFMLSDSLIAIGKFVSPVPMQDLLVMGTYAAAQFLIVTGVIKRNQAG